MLSIEELLKSERPATYLFYGDSITHGVVHTFGARDYTQLFAERLRCELNRPLDIVINSAITGDTTKELLNNFNWRCKRFSPDAIFLMIGMNDCSKKYNVPIEIFRGNLEKLIKKFLDIKAIPILQTTCPILLGTSPDREPFFESYMQAIRDIVEKFRVPLIDHLKYWQINSAKFYLLMSNEFHPNYFGHRMFAKYIYKSLGIYDTKSSSCNLFIP